LGIRPDRRNHGTCSPSPAAAIPRLRRKVYAERIGGSRVESKLLWSWLMSWDRPFDQPVPLPSGLPARTLRDAGNYIRTLPKSERDRPEWRLAIHMLIDAAEDRGPMLFAKMGILRATEQHSESVLGLSGKAPPSLRRKAQTERRGLRLPRAR
jgi:hypothetical protein